MIEVEININSQYLQPKVVIHTHEITEEVQEISNRIRDISPFQILGYQDGYVQIIPQENCIRFFTEGQKVLAQTTEEILPVKQRLYELEEKLIGTSFVRISNSEIVNFKKVKKLDLTFAGTICLAFLDGGTAFVSRRYVPKIREYLGI